MSSTTTVSRTVSQRPAGRDGHVAAPPDGVALVLGGGGTVGLAYQVGALRALEEIGGVDVRRSTLMIGTSAGAFVAAQLRLGRSYDEISSLVADDETAPTAADVVDPSPSLTPAWQSRSELYRRMVGSSWTASRAMVRIPVPRPPRMLQQLFPPSLFCLGESVWSDAGVTDAWPDDALWIITVDIDSGRRIVLKRPTRPTQTGTLHQAVAASCAVPALYPPVHIGGRRLVDGGVRSSTNLDLARHSGCSMVIALAPMGFDPLLPPSVVNTMWRSRFNSQLHRESATVRRADGHVLLLRPSGDELRLHGSNMLRRSGSRAVTSAAYEATARVLSSSDAVDFLGLARAALGRGAKRVFSGGPSRRAR